MQLFVAVTDNDWFALHASKQSVDEVNFWRPSPEANFKVLQPGELLLFKLKSPNDSIAGGGFFTRFLQMPINMAWETFGEANGVRSLPEFRSRIARIRNVTMQVADNPNVGCIMLAEPFFWPKSEWIPRPPEFAVSNQVGKTFDSEEGAGRRIWDAICERLKRSPASLLDQDTATVAAIESNGFGKPQIVHPRLGQGLFRVLVKESYSRKCAITGERTLPVLEAAHIKPYSMVMRHEVSNGLLLRSDLHKLFDEGYLTVDPQDRRVVVSRRIKEEFENGKEYYRLEENVLREPTEPWARPSLENLEYHAYNVFR
ncbi:HNH endonuclease [Paludibaculum fermentans]|uniref:HNH endonuclease n=1 Tax=Paludibaculum fermentans TaxID=1473598 RepID=UPI003EB86101